MAMQTLAESLYLRLLQWNHAVVGLLLFMKVHFVVLLLMMWR